MARRSKGTKEQSIYSVHPMVAHQQAMIKNLEERTGQTLAQWVRLLEKTGPTGAKERRAWLKAEHKLGGATVMVIVGAAEGDDETGGDADAYLKAAPRYVDAMYAGHNAQLRPLHDALVALARSLGDNVKVCPCKTIVPFYRERVFAEIKPTTHKRSDEMRIDLGLALKDAKKKPSARLVDTGGLAKGDRITHRIPLCRVEEIDREVQDWLRLAYALDA